MTVSIKCSVTDMKLIGQWFPGSDLFSFSNIGVTLANFHSPGVFPVVNDLLKRAVKGLTISYFASSLSWRKLIMASYFIYFHSVYTFSMFIFFVVLLQYILLSLSVKLDLGWVVTSVLNTNAKMTFKIFAMALLSWTKSPFSVSNGPTD